ncbi:MAG TPA: GreA/GreB family elongation factor [Chthoniobacterales bacterium]|nr:GreA/GreB family elongation factor [Chthoniobacterales bacterium]
MNISIILFILTAIFVSALLILFVGGLLVRADVHRAADARRGRNYPRSHTLEDLRGIQNLMIDFIAKSRPSRRLLGYLTGNDKPVRVMALVRYLRNASSNADSGITPFAGEKIWTALIIMAVSGLIRFGRRGISLSPVGHEVQRRLNVMPDLKATKSKSAVTISAADYQELSAAVVTAKKLALDPGDTALLQEKLVQATVLNHGDLPSDLITMNSRAELVDLETNESLDVILVYPVDASIADGRISVFDALGVAILGHRVGDKFQWPVPYGVRRFEVKSIRFQPEAALQLAA